MKKVSPVIQLFFRDLTIFCIMLYFSLLILNIILQGFIPAIFPINILGWITLALILVQLFITRQPKT